MRPLLLFGVWSCVGVCSRLADPPGTSADSADTDTSSTAPPLTGTAEHVVIVVIDGARIDETFGTGESDAAGGVPTSSLFTYFKEQMLPQGTLVLPGYNTGVTITAPGHADILTGTRNLFAHFPTPNGPGFYRPEHPTLFEAARAKWPDDDNVLVANSDHIEPLSASVFPGITADDGAVYTFVSDADDPEQPSQSDVDVLAALQAQLEATGAHVALANLHDMDRKGHYNDSPTAYASGVERVSSPISSFWDWIQSSESGLKDKTMLVLVADHGRHRWGAEAEERGADLRFDWDYSEHGDQCAGCREVPMFLVGPNIRQGVTLTSPHSLEDIGATAAFALGVDLPYATGRVIREAFTEDPGSLATDSGLSEIAVSDGVTLRALLTDDVSARTTIDVDGTELSGADAAILREGPVLASTAQGQVACWRELHLDWGTDEIDFPWTPECRLDDGSGWTDLSFPAEMVFPFWRPAIAEMEDGTLLFAFSDNQNSNAYSTSRGGVALFGWSPADGWTGSTEERHGTLFAGNPTVAVLGGTAWVAWAESDIGTNDKGAETTNPSRYTRHISLQRVGSPRGPGWTEVWRNYTDGCPDDSDCPATTPSPDTDGNTWERMELPALSVRDQGLQLAWVSWAEGAVAVHVMTSSAEAASFAKPVRADTNGSVLGHVQPVWKEQVLYFAQLGKTGTVEVCRWQGSAAECVDTGAGAVRALAADGADVVAVAQAAGGSWEALPVVW